MKHWEDVRCARPMCPFGRASLGIVGYTCHVHLFPGLLEVKEKMAANWSKRDHSPNTAECVRFWHALEMEIYKHMEREDQTVPGNLGKATKKMKYLSAKK